MTISTEREEDGRWIAEVHDVPGALAYGASLSEAVTAAVAIAESATRARAPNMIEAPPGGVPSQKDIDDLRAAAESGHEMVVTRPYIVLYLLSLLPMREPDAAPAVDTRTPGLP